MADPPADETEKGSTADGDAAPAAAPEAPKLSADMEAAKRYLAEHAARIPAGMPEPILDPRERRARWMRVSVLVSVLLLGVGLAWSHFRVRPVPANVVARARTEAAPHWAALSRCLVGEPLAHGERASSRMRRIYLALPRADQRAVAADPTAWPGRCAAEARALTDALRTARASDAKLGDLAATSIGVWTALTSGRMPGSVDALFRAAGDARLPEVDAPSDVDAPPPLTLPDRAMLEAHALEGPNVRVVEADDHRVLLRGERDLLCGLDADERTFACHVVPGDAGALSGLTLVPGAGTRPLAFYRDPAATASKILDLASGATVAEGALEVAEARGDDVLAVRGRPPTTPEVLAGATPHGPTLSLTTSRDEVRLWAPAIGAAAPGLAGLVAWATLRTPRANGAAVAGPAETILHVAGTGDSAAFVPTAERRVSLGADAPLDVTACVERGTRAVLVQLGELPAPAALPRRDGGAGDPTAVPPTTPHGTGRRPYQPVATDLPEERAAGVALVGADGVPTLLRLTLAGAAVLSCEEGAAVVTTWRSAADRTGESDEPGDRPWRLRAPGLSVTQHRCTNDGCTARTAELQGFRDEPEVRAQDGHVVVFFRASAAGGLRLRAAAVGELAAAEDVVLADDQAHDGIEVREQRIGTGPRGALLVARTSAGVLVWRVDAHGDARLLSGAR